MTTATLDGMALAASADEAAPARDAADEAIDENFNAFFRRLYPRLTAQALRVTGDRGLAEEIAAEALRRMHPRWRPEESGAARDAWLRRVTLNLALQALRSRRRRLRHESDAQVEVERRALQANPQELTLAAERQAQVRRVLAALSRRSARLLLLRFDGLRYQEIAMVLELNPASVGKLTARALAEFEKRFIRLYGRKP